MLPLNEKIPPGFTSWLKTIAPPPSVTVTSTGSRNPLYFIVMLVNPPWQGPQLATGGQLQPCAAAFKDTQTSRSTKMSLRFFSNADRMLTASIKGRKKIKRFRMRVLYS
jgi:hypothetical protein